MKKVISILMIMLVAGFISNPTSKACTNFLVTKGASKYTGSVMITYSADFACALWRIVLLAGQGLPEGAWLDV